MIRDSLLSLEDRLGIAQIVMADWLHLGIQLVNKRHSGGNVQLEDILVRNVIEVFYECPQTVPVRGNDYTLACDDGRCYRLVLVRKHPRNRVLQAFCAG